MCFADCFLSVMSVPEKPYFTTSTVYILTTTLSAILHYRPVLQGDYIHRGWKLALQGAHSSTKHFFSLF